MKTGGLKVILDNLVAVAANAAKANPSTTATVAVTTATGGLLAGTYRCSYTFCDAYGETLAGGESATFTVTGTTQLATVTLPALPTGVQAINLYLTPANGGVSGTEYLYATGITGTTYACTPTLPTDVPGATTPASNTTGGAVHYARLYAPINDNPEIILHGVREWESAYLGGAPMDRAAIFRRHLLHWGTMLTWAQVFKEAATLAWANQGTLTTTQGPIYATTKNVL
jgi:hypothetical protein